MTFGYSESQKYKASSLEEFLRIFDESKNGQISIQPYFPKYVMEGEADFALIVECEGAIWERGFSRNWFIYPESFRFKTSKTKKVSYFDFRSIKPMITRFEDFVWGLYFYLIEKGYPAVLSETQHLDRKPEKNILNKTYAYDKSDFLTFSRIQGKMEPLREKKSFI